MVEIVADFNVFIMGIGQIGTATKIKVPEVKQHKETHTSATGDYEISIGQFEKMEAEVTIWDENIIFYPQVGMLNNAELMCVEAVKAGDDARAGLYEFGGVMDISTNESSRKGKKEITLKISCNRAYHNINGLEAYFIDFKNNIARVGGIDTMDKVRKIARG
jgi:P2 family phage contractile tail tube protein